MTTIGDVLSWRCAFCGRERPREEMLLGSDKDDILALMLRGFDGRKCGAPFPTAMCRTDRRACDAIYDAADV